MKNRVKIIVF